MKTCKLDGCNNEVVGHHMRKYCNDNCSKEARELIWRDRKGYQKDYHDNRSLDHWIVYELKCGYIGITSSPHGRMRFHKYAGRDVSDYITLAVCYCKREAAEFEALYQSLSDRYTRQDSSKIVIKL